MFAITMNAQKALKKVYDEQVNPLRQIEQALGKAKAEGKFVICQVGGTGVLGACGLLTLLTPISKVQTLKFHVQSSSHRLYRG